MLRVVCIGAGRLAHHLMPRLELAGLGIVQVYNRTEERGAALVQHLKDATLTSSLDDIVTDADLFFLTVSDDMVPVIAVQLAELKLSKGIVVHCSGVLGLDALPFVRKGIFYPLQTFSSQHAVPWATTPILVTAEDRGISDTLKSIASKITEAVYEVSDAQKSVLHVSAVFANNFTNHMLSIAEDICLEHQVSFDILKPLIRETIEKAVHLGPSHSQTGPAVRGDQHTLDRHIAFLQNHPEYQELYRKISADITRFAARFS